MSFQAIRKSTAPEMVVEQILKKINTGELAPGGKLPSQRELATLFGVGRSSVREAFNALAVMGYLEILQGKGTFIRNDPPTTDPSVTQLNAALTAGSIMDLMEARELVECKSVELAAERADDAQIRKLKKIVTTMAGATDDYERFLEADIKFHYALAEASQNAVICEMMKLLVEKVVDHHSKFKTGLISRTYRENSLSTARNVVSHLEKKEPDAAVDFMREHLNAIQGELKTII